jgi:hypothetical protein
MVKKEMDSEVSVTMGLMTDRVCPRQHTVGTFQVLSSRTWAWAILRESNSRS